MTEPTPAQRVALIFEVETAANLIRAGLAELGLIDGANRFYRLPMTLLGQGLERLMKVTIALERLESVGALPTSAWMKSGFGHELGKLASACTAIVARPGYVASRPAAAEDAVFLTSDPDLPSALAAVQGYAERERYADLDRFLDPAATTPDPGARLDEIEWAILRRHPEWEARPGASDFSGCYPVMVGELMTTFQRFARAVSRLFVWGPLGELGQAASGPLSPLLTARDGYLHQLPKKWMIQDASRGIARMGPLRLEEWPRGKRQ